jgi:hemimethylated DNA binding protein
MASFSLASPLPALQQATSGALHTPVVAPIVGSKFQQFAQLHAAPTRAGQALAAALSAGALAFVPKSKRQHCRRVQRHGGGVDTTADGNEALLAKLQGHWSDDVGNSIIISGDLARFSDGTGAWRIDPSDEDGTLEVRGARFVGTPERPTWRFESGVERHLVKRENMTWSEIVWADVFHQFKDAQTQIRQRIWANVAAGDIDAAVTLQDSWVNNISFPLECSLEQQALLASGRWHLPGVCFRHKRYGYRGMIIACEPWCAAPATWRNKMTVSATPRGETQPFYHCLVDERDRPGGQSTYVPEEDIEICHNVTMEHWLVRVLFVRCEEIRGYLPIPKLSSLLWKQWATCCPIWEASQTPPPATAQQLS